MPGVLRDLGDVGVAWQGSFLVRKQNLEGATRLVAGFLPCAFKIEHECRFPVPLGLGRQS